MTDNHEESQNVTELQRLLTGMSLIQLKYIAARPHVNSNTAAAEAVGIARETVSRWPNKADIERAIQLMALDGVQVAGELFRRHLPAAAQEIVEELEHKNVSVRHKAATEILDRALGKAAQTVKAELSGEVKTGDGLSDEERADRLLALLDKAGARRTGQADSGGGE